MVVKSKLHGGVLAIDMRKVQVMSIYRWWLGLRVSLSEVQNIVPGGRNSVGRTECHSLGSGAAGFINTQRLQTMGLNLTKISVVVCHVLQLANSAMLEPQSQNVVYNLLAHNHSLTRSLSHALQMGGSESIINALIRGLEKNGGRLVLRSHVDQIVMENGRAVGVALRPRSPAPSPSNGASNGSSAEHIASSVDSSGSREFIRARKGVISNASVWDTQKLLAPGVGPREWRRKAITTPTVSES